MRYAKSILLVGEMIDAEQATYNDFKDLIMVCPCCDSEVFLTRGFERTSKKGRRHCVQSTWKHYSDRSFSGVIECEARSQYSPQVVEAKNAIARKQRLKFYRQRVWDLIKRSPFLKGEDLNKHIDMMYKNDVLLWLFEIVSKITRETSFDTILSENGLLLEYFLQADPETDDERAEAVRMIIIQDRNREYRKQVSSEALNFILKNWSGNDLKKFFAIAVNDDIICRIDKWFEYNYSVLMGAVDPHTRHELAVFYRTNRREAIGIMEDCCKSTKEYSEIFMGSLNDLVVSLIRVLMLILLSLPWMEEFKKFTKHQQEVY